MSRGIDLRGFTPPPPTLIDRVVGYFSPEAGIRRHRARTAMALTGVGGYFGGRRDRRRTRSWRPYDSSADQAIIPDLPDLRSRSRDLVRNMPIATGAIETAVTNIVGDGLTLQSTIDREYLGLSEQEADAWQAAAEREFRLWAGTSDFTRAQPWQEQQDLALRSVLESGDMLVVRRYRRDAGDTYGTKLQFVEADRISNPQLAADKPELIAGVALDKDGVATGFHIADKHPGEFFGSAAKWSTVPARSKKGIPLALHLFTRKRPGQTRGVPYLSPVIESLKMLGNYSEAEVTAAVIGAMFTVFVTTKPDDETNDIIGTTKSDSDVAVNDSGKEIALEDAGAIVELDEGQDVTIANPGRPNPVFDAFMTAMLRQVGVALELPFELLVKHFTASYSASRAALEMAWQFFRRRRTWMARRFCQPIYEWVLEEAIARGRLAAPGFFEDPLIRQAYCQAQWIGPMRPSIDPKKDSDADAQDVAEGFKTIAQVCLERTGGDFETKHAQRAKEARMRRDGGLANKAAPAAPPPPPAEPDDDAGDDGDLETSKAREPA